MDENFNLDDLDFDFLSPISTIQDTINCSKEVGKISSYETQGKTCKISGSTKNKRSRLAERIVNTDLVVRQQADLQKSANEIKNLYEKEREKRIQIEERTANWQIENESLKSDLAEWQLKYEQLEAGLKENKTTLDVKELVAGYVRVAQKLSDQCSFNALHKRDILNLNQLKKFCIDNRISIFKRTPGLPKVDKSVECLLWTANPERVRKPDKCTRATQCVRVRTQEQGTQHQMMTVSCGTMTSQPVVPKLDAATNFHEPRELSPFRAILRDTINAWEIKPISPIKNPPAIKALMRKQISPTDDVPELHVLETTNINPIKEMQPISPIDDPQELHVFETTKISPIDPLESSVKQTQSISPIKTSSRIVQFKPICSMSDDPQESLAEEINESSEQAATQEIAKETKTVGTCTDLCNVLTNVENVLVLPKIKRCDSRPPSRTMFSNVKDELSSLNLPYGGLKDFFNEKLLSSKNFGDASQIPNFTPDMFEELWQLFGQMVLGLLQRRSTNPSTRSEDLNSWLPKMSEAYQNLEHDNLLHKAIPVSVPCAASIPNNSMDENTNPATYVNQQTCMTDIVAKTKSFGTSPIRPDEFESITMGDERENVSNYEKTSEIIGLKRRRLSTDRSVFRPIDLSQEKLSNTSNTNTPTESSNETAVIFLSSLSTFKNVYADNLENLDESEMELLASADFPIHLTENVLESTKGTKSTVDESSDEMEVVKITDNFNQTTTEFYSNQSLHEDILSQPPTDVIDENVAENNCIVEDDEFDNLIIDETISTSGVSLDEENMDCSLKSESLMPYSHVSNDSKTLFLSCDDTNNGKSTVKAPRKRSRKTDTFDNSPKPCKRSARLAKKRLIEENKSKFPTKCENIATTNIPNSFKKDERAYEIENCDTPKLSSNLKITDYILDANVPKELFFPVQKSATSPLANNLYQQEMVITSEQTFSTTSTMDESIDRANKDNNFGNNSECEKLRLCAASPHSMDALESPSSPQSFQDDNDQYHADFVPIQIPLNLSKSPVKRGSLLKNLIIKEKQKKAGVKKKVNNRDNKSIAQMHAIISEYLDKSNQFDITEEVRNVCIELERVSQKEDLYISALLASDILKLAENDNQEIKSRFMNLIKYLHGLYPKFLTEFLCKLDKKLFTFDQSVKRKFSESLHLLNIYLALINLQASTSINSKYRNPARIVISKILYYYQKDGVRFIYEVLCRFPTVLPPRSEKTYDHSDPLITVIKCELMNYKYDMYDNSCGRELLSKLRYEYHFETFKPQSQDVLNQLMGKLESGQLRNLQLCFAIFCKRLSNETCLRDVINGRLLPLINTYYDLAKLSSEYDERIAVLFTCLSTILKTFPLKTDITAYLSVFTRFLCAIKRPCVQEAAVQAIIRLQRYGYNLCGEALEGFQHNFTLQPLTAAMLRSFAQRKIK